MILNSPYITGSLTVTGDATIAGNITVTGSLSGTAATASFALTLGGTGSVGFATTGAFSATSGSASSRLTQIEQVYATTGSNSFRATQSITGSLTVTGQIIAQTLNVQQVTSSIVFSSGSNTFGCDINSRQTFTGSVIMTGSLIVNTTGPELQVNNNGVVLGNLLTDNHSITGSLRITGSLTGTGVATFSSNVPQLLTIASTATLGSYIAFTNSGTLNGAIGNGANIIACLSNCDLGLWTTGVMAFQTNGLERMRITTCGNVGIGTSCPTEMLHLNNTSTNAAFIRFQNTGGSGVYIGGRSNDMELYAGGSERAIITSCGNIGIGVKPAAWTLLCAVQIRNVSIAGYTTGNTHIFYAANNWYYAGGDRYITNGFASLYSQAEGSHVFYNASCNTSGADTALTFCERLRITSGGDVLVRASTVSYPTSGRGNITIGGACNQSAILGMQVGGVDRTYLFSNNQDTYIDNASGTGNVVVLNGTGGVKLERNATSWISNSDERLKNINSNIENALDKVLTLRAVNFSWKEDDANKENLGLIAQDVEKVFPQVVNKSKLAKSIDSNNDDETEYLGIRYTELVPVLVKAIQELKCENNTFKSCLGIA